MVQKLHQLPGNERLRTHDPIWKAVCSEAEAVLRSEPALGSFVFATILGQDTLEEAIIHRLAQRLNHTDLDAGLISKTFRGVLQ